MSYLDEDEDIWALSTAIGGAEVVPALACVVTFVCRCVVRLMYRSLLANVQGADVRRAPRELQLLDLPRGLIRVDVVGRAIVSVITRRRILRKVPVLAMSFHACLTLAACSDATDVNYARRPSQLRYFDFRDNVTVPDSIDRSAAFAVRIATYGDGCAQLGDTPVSIAGKVITIEPHDVFATGKNVACPDILRSLEHTASISIATPGVMTIYVRGRDYPADSTLVLERQLVVR